MSRFYDVIRAAPSSRWRRFDAAYARGHAVNLLALLVLLLFGATLYYDRSPPGPDEAEIAAVRDRLATVQIESFASDREYCGYLYRDAEGALTFTPMQQGDRDGCTPVLPYEATDLIASVHTHGAYSADVPAEFPTVLDMDSDRAEAINGYIGTPGGRLWYIDSHARMARQLCGLGCLPQDPNFRPGDDGEIAQTYSRRALQRLEAPLNPP